MQSELLLLINILGKVKFRLSFPRGEKKKKKRLTPLTPGCSSRMDLKCQVVRIIPKGKLYHFTSMDPSMF